MPDHIIRKDITRSASKYLTTIYTASLVALGSVTVGGHYYLHTVKETKENVAQEINLAGRQRMLSQRLTKDVLILSDTRLNDNASIELEETLAQFKRVQKGLVYGDPELRLQGLKVLKEDNFLHNKFKEIEKPFLQMVELAEMVLITSPADRENVSSRLKGALITNEEPYVTGMDEIVSKYVQNAQEFDNKIKNLENAILLFNLLCMGAIGIGVFRPLTRYIRQAFTHIEREKTELEDIINYRTKEVRTLSSAVEQSPLAVLITDEHGFIKYANPAFTKVTGFTLDDVLGKNPSMLASGETDSSVYSGLWNKLNNRQTWSGVLKNKHKSGRTMYVLSTIAPIFEEQESITNYIGIQQDITDRLAAEQDLIESEARMAAVMDTVPDAIITINLDGTINSFNKAAESIFGYSSDEMIGQSVDIIVPDEYKEAHRNGIKRFAASGKGNIMGTRVELEALTKSGRRIWIEMALSSVNAGNKRYVTGLLRDISEKKVIEEATRVSAVAFETQEGIFVTDASGKILKVNNAFTTLTGYTSADVVGKYPSILKSGQHDKYFYEHMRKELEQNKVWQGEVWNRRKNGEIFPEWQTITAVTNTKGVVTHYVSVFTDITQRKQTEDHIKTLAFFDPLTKLPNRRLLIDRMTHAIENTNANKSYNALMFLDLDHFKNLNDTQGHDKGDLLLKEVANRLKQCIRTGDTVARLSGDEFVVMLENLGLDEVTAATLTENIAENISTSLNRPYILKSETGETEYVCSASIGICMFNDNISVEDLLKHADVAMYQSKNDGRNTIRFFDPQMQTYIQERTKLESDLRTAIAKQNLYLTYQVQVNQDKKPIGAEALVRWNHPELGHISPAKFIPLAEESGLIYDLGLFVLETTCKQLREWETHPVASNIPIAVNVSAKQFRQENFIEDFKRIVESHNVSYEMLKIELTESALLDNVDNMIEKMTKIRQLGCQLSMDDFGTGYSSLSYLKLLPLNQLKIDQSFTRDILDDHNDEAIASIIISLGHTLDLNVIAEGVETEAQYKLLKSYDCQWFQGYFFGKPVKADEFIKLVENLHEAD